MVYSSRRPNYANVLVYVCFAESFRSKGTTSNRSSGDVEQDITRMDMGVRHLRMRFLRNEGHIIEAQSVEVNVLATE